MIQVKRSSWAFAVAALLGCGPSLAASESQTPPESRPRPEASEPAPSSAPAEAGTREGQAGHVQKVFVIRHVSPLHLATLLQIFPAAIRSVDRPGLKALAVSAKPAVLAAIEQTIERLDRPATEPASADKGVEITGYVLEGLAEAAEAEALPPALDPVVAELRRAFKYTAYRRLDTIVARVRGDGSRFGVEGVTEKRLSPLAPAYYELRAQTTVTGDDPRYVRLKELSFTLNVPVPASKATAEFTYKQVGLRSDIDIRDGQHVVVGKSGLGDSENALVLVLTARVVD